MCINCLISESLFGYLAMMTFQYAFPVLPQCLQSSASRLPAQPATRCSRNKSSQQFKALSLKYVYGDLCLSSFESLRLCVTIYLAQIEPNFPFAAINLQ